MIKCGNCQSTNIDGSIFCTQCGAKLTSSSGTLLDEMMLYKDNPIQAKALEQKKRIDQLDRLISATPPTVQQYPSLNVIALLLMMFGWLLMLGGLFGFGSIYFSPLSEGISYPMATPTPLSDGRPGPRISSLSQPLSAAARTTTEIISGGLLVIGFLMVAGSELMKLFIDLQENADRQSIVLHGIYHLLLKEQERFENEHSPTPETTK